MLNNLNKGTWIIPPWDPRYGKLGHIWKKYTKANITCNTYGKSYYYYIPPELILKEYNGSTTRVIKKSIFGDDSWDNWVLTRGSSNLGVLLDYCCNLTIKEYFCLIDLQINDLNNRLRCTYCKTLLTQFINMSQGYSHIGKWEDSSDLFCCNECQRLYHENYNKLMLNSVIPTIKRQRSCFITKSYVDEPAYFYITFTKSGLLKYGISQDIYSRIDSSRIRGDIYINPHILLESDVTEVANLEARLKLKFGGKEYLKSGQLHDLINELKVILANRPIANPFD